MPEPQPSLRILVVEDEFDTARFVVHILERRGGHRPVHVPTAAEAMEAITHGQWDVMITDLHLPGIDGNELVRWAQEIRPNLPAILMTAFPEIDVVVDAMRSGVIDFLAKPVSPDVLLERVMKAYEGAHPAQPKQRILAIGTHPDDVEIGIGGTLLNHRSLGDEVTILTLTQGSVGGEAGVRAQEAHLAAEMLGATLVLGDLTDTEIPDGMPTVATIEEVIAQVEPGIVYTHSDHDLHQDHRAVHRATLAAARNIASIYCYQSPSATVDFRPSRFEAIDFHISGKIKLVQVFRSQTERSPSLSEEYLRATAIYWGRFSDGRSAEPLEVIHEQVSISMGLRQAELRADG